MSRVQFVTTVSTALIAYLIVAFWKAPQTDGGRLLRKLCLVNVVSWVIVLPLDDTGHPPPALFVGGILWLLNLPLLVAAIVTLWVTVRAHDENKLFLTGTSLYVALNVLTLWILPIYFLVSLMRAG